MLRAPKLLREFEPRTDMPTSRTMALDHYDAGGELDDIGDGGRRCLTEGVSSIVVTVWAVTFVVSDSALPGDDDVGRCCQVERADGARRTGGADCLLFESLASSASGRMGPVRGCQSAALGCP